MTNLQKVLTTHFGSLEIDVVQADGQPEPGITGKQLGEMLEYAFPQEAIDKIYQRNKERLDQFSVQVKMTGTDGKSYDTRIYGFKGILEVCRFSNQPNANAVMDWAWENLDRLRRGRITVPLSQQTEFHRLHERIDRLEDENYHLRQRVSGLANGHGSFQLWDVAQQLRKNGIGNGNLHKLITLMVAHGLLMKDTSVKKRTFYRPFLKDIRAGYFDHELTHNGQPVPVWKSDITVTAKGLDWIIETFLSLRDRKWERERPMIRHSRETQRRLADVSAEVGGTIYVEDYNGNEVAIN